MNNSNTQHEQLIAKGWIYDKASDTYRAPGSKDDGTARRYNVGAAWQAQQIADFDEKDAAQDPKDATQAAPPPNVRHQRDPRVQEPE